MNALVDGLFEQYVEAIAMSRGLEPAAVRGLIDRGPFLASEAKAAGLVDELLYRDEVEGRVPGARLAAAPYVRSGRAGAFDRRPKLALVYAVGDLMPGDSQDGPFGNVAGSDTIIQGLREAREDASVRAVVLRVDSPAARGRPDAIWRGCADAPGEAGRGLDGRLRCLGRLTWRWERTHRAQPDDHRLDRRLLESSPARALLEAGISQETVQRGATRALPSYEPWTAQRAKVRALNQAFYETFVSRCIEGTRRRLRSEARAGRS